MAIGYWDLSHLYKSNDEFLKDFNKAKMCLKNLKKFKGKLCKTNADDIHEYFLYETNLTVLLEKLIVYAFCKQDDDGKNTNSVKNYNLINDFYSKVNEDTAFARTELASHSEDFLTGLINNPQFADYDRTLNDIIRYKKHTLSEKEEQNMALVSSFANTNDIFSVLSNVEMFHGEFVDENGEKIKLFPGNYNKYMSMPNSNVRREVNEIYLAEYKKLNQTFSNLFTSHVKYQNYVAKCYGFDSVLHMKTYAEEVSPEIMMVNIKNVKSRVGLLQDYFKLKQKILNLNEFRSSDIGVGLFADTFKSISYDEAVKGIKEAFKVLGEDYVQMFDEAVNNGWIDAFPREGKKGGGYTTGTYNEHPYILLNFDGTMDWASAIAHEFGHAMHSYYSAKNQPVTKYEYTLFVAEVVSLTNEILYNNYLLNSTKDKKLKMKLIADFLQLFMLNVYDSSMLAEFELFAHGGLQNGETFTAEDYNNKFVELSKEYFGDMVYNEGYEVNWSRKGLA